MSLSRAVIIDVLSTWWSRPLSLGRRRKWLVISVGPEWRAVSCAASPSSSFYSSKCKVVGRFGKLFGGRLDDATEMLTQLCSLCVLMGYERVEHCKLRSPFIWLFGHTSIFARSFLSEMRSAQQLDKKMSYFEPRPFSFWPEVRCNTGSTYVGR